MGAKRKKVTVKKRRADIGAVVAAVNGSLGAGSLTTVGGAGASIPIKTVWTTGLETVDLAWGRGGQPDSRVTILHGKEGAGKTTIALLLAAAAQAAGAVVLFIDAEYKLDIGWARICGLDTDDAVISQPKYLEQAFAVIEATINAAASIGCPAFIVLDSMNACDTKGEFEASWEDEAAYAYGPKAKIYSRILPKLVPTIQRTDSVLTLVSQVRGGPKGNHIACGNAPKFYASSILNFRKPKGHRVKVGDAVVATELEVEFIKNQVAPPYRVARFRIDGNGPDRDWALIEAAVKRGFVSKGGGGWSEWSRGEGEPLKWQGVGGWMKLVEDSPEIRTELRAAVREPYLGR